MAVSLRRPVQVVSIAAAALLASCYSTATLHTARPIESGETQMAVALGSFVGEEDGDFAALPTLEGQVRFGLDERYDAGMHVTNLGSIGADFNYALFLGETQAVSVDPSVEFTFGTYGWLPVLWDFHRTDSLTLTASVRGGRYWRKSGDDEEDFLLDSIEADAWLYGGGLAAQIRLNESLALAPELRVIWVDSDDLESPDPLISFSLGLVF